METEKEGRLRYFKSYDGCASCHEYYFSCRKCKGLCIFSKLFFEKVKTDARLRKNLRSKYYNKEFKEILHNLNSEPNDTDTITEIDIHDEDLHLKLLEIFWKDVYSYQSILKSHNLVQGLSRKPYRRFALYLSGKAHLSRRCHGHKRETILKSYRSQSNEKDLPRHKRWQNLIQNNQDFILKKDNL